ncbi:MAG: prepilin-type N-terminal cleavage/methylation domain-containing protein [Patescibacteria group bacterium]
MKQTGFTLIELLIVIAIIAITAGLLTGCGGGGGKSVVTPDTTAKVVVKFSLPTATTRAPVTDVKFITITVTGINMAPISQTVDFDGANTAEMSLDVPVGQRTFQADAKDKDEKIIFTGKTTQDITAGTVNSIAIDLNSTDPLGQVTLNISMPPGETGGLSDVTQMEIVAQTNLTVMYTDKFDCVFTGSLTRPLMLNINSYEFTVNALSSAGTVLFTGKSGLVAITEGNSTPVSITLQPPATGVGVGLTIWGDLGPPTIYTTYVPPYGDPKDTILRGKVTGVLPDSAHLLVYIYYNSWIIKPYNNNYQIKIDSNGYWACQTYTGGYDYNATAFRVYLVTNDYGSSAMPPDPPTAQSLAMLEIPRPRP